MTDPDVSGLAAEPDAAVLVTGAAGFLGSRVVRMLSDSGACEVIATDVTDGSALEALPRVRFQRCDLRDGAALEGLVRRSTHVVHLAALRSKASQTGVRQGLEVNVGSTYDLLGMAARDGVRGFVYGSSHLVYGPFHEPGRRPFVEEDAAVRPGLTLYAAAKIASEAFVQAFSTSFGLRHLSLRFGGIYGPQAAPGSNSSAMLDVLAAVDRGDPPAVTWRRDTIHALIYVDDAARAVVRALDFPLEGTAVNVVGPPLSCELIYTTLMRQYGADPALLTWPSKPVRYQLVSAERLANGLGCPPVTTLEQGLKAIIGWHRNTVG